MEEIRFTTPVVGSVLGDDKVPLARKFLSNHAFCFIVSQMILKKEAFSVVRMGDGERSIIFGRERHYVDPEWAKVRGCVDDQGNLISNGRLADDLVAAGNRATFFGPSLHGLFLPAYDLFGFFNARDTYVDALYPSYWLAHGYVGDFLRIGKSLIACFDHDRVVKTLTENHNLPMGQLTGVELKSWSDKDRILSTISSSDVDMVLVAGGPPGKLLVVEAAENCNKPVLDVGDALRMRW